MSPFDEDTLNTEDVSSIPIEEPIDYTEEPTPAAPVEAPLQPQVDSTVQDTQPPVEAPVAPPQSVPEAIAPTQVTDNIDVGSMPIEEPIDNAQNVDPASMPIEEPTDNPPESGLTKDQIINSPDDFEKVRRYMVNRMGNQWKDKSPEETMDAFTTHMRYFGNNDFTTLGELRYNLTADDKQKNIINDAYSVYDKLGSFLTNDGVGGAAGAVFDYGIATLLSPTTYIGAGIGGKIATKTAALGAKEALNFATKEALKAGGVEAAQTVLKTAARQKAIHTAVAATLVDVPINVGMDYIAQSAKIATDFQPGYDPTEGAVAGISAIIGGGIGAIPHLTKGISGLGGTDAMIAASKAARRSSSAAVAGPKIAASLKEAVPKLTKSMKDWSEVVASGKAINPNMLDMSEATKWFFDVSDPNSVFRIISDSGADISLDSEERFTDQILDFARGLPQGQLDKINEEMAPIGLSFGQLLDVVGAVQSQGGTNMNMASQASKYARAAYAAVVEKNKVDEAVVRNSVMPNLGDETKNATNPQVAKYVASLWRRTLVSHPATTAVNVQGWVQAFGMDTMAEILHGGVLGSYGMANLIFNRNKGLKYLGQSKQLMKNQAYKLRMLLDPLSSKDGFEAIIAHSNEKTKKLVNQTMFGGVTDKNVPELYGINPSNKIARGAEATADMAARLTMIKVQDVYTKTFSGMSELDKLSRLKYGKGIDTLINEGNYHLITPEMWQSTVNEMLKQTFSADYTKGTGALNKLANAVEQLSNAPYLGFIFPFGRFMNNNLAFAMAHSPIGLIPIASDIYKGGKRAFNYDLMEKTSRVMAGSIALGYLFNKTQGDQNEGLQWYESEQSDGTVVNRQNQAPAALFRLSARIGKLIANGEGVNKDLWKEMLNQIGYGSLSRQVDNGNALSDIVGYLSSPDRNEDVAQQLEQFIAFAGKEVATVGVGFTRPLDFPNKLVGMNTGSDVSIDRKQAKGASEVITQELTRYTDSFFAPFFGTGKTTEGVPTMGIPARSATGPKGDIRDPNPVSSLMGVKELPPKLPINTLLGQVNKPPFTVESRTASPEFDNFRDEAILPILNNKATALMKAPYWKTLPYYQRVNEVNKIVEEAQKEVIDNIDNGITSNLDASTFNERRKWSILPESDRIAAKNAYGISKDDRELSSGEISVLKEYIKERNDFLDYLKK